MNAFDDQLAKNSLTLTRDRLQTLQINVGRKCNQTCRHCHVDAAPWRPEMMDETTAHKIGAWIQQYRPAVVDITGGAPELNPFFCYLVETSCASGAHVIDRNNLTIIETPPYRHLPEYLARHRVEIIASLPCYSAKNVDQQRGEGVFHQSIAALKKLNAVGYGKDLPLHLVYNPLGASLPGPQAELEADYKAALQRDYGIVFHRLYTITNQPIARFAEDLRRQGAWDDYLGLLAGSFNPATVDGLMCRTTLSVDYRGELYDCDFNQMLGMRLDVRVPVYLWDCAPDQFFGKGVRTGIHCLACTAGAGSSCTGALNIDQT